MSDDRAVSTALSFVLGLAIAALLVAGLLIAGSGFVSDSRDSVVRNELAVIAEQILADLDRVDRLVVAGDGVETAAVTQTFPRAVAGSAYVVALDPGASKPLALRAAATNVSVSLPVATDTDLAASSVAGGPVTVRYDSGASAVVIESGE